MIQNPPPRFKRIHRAVARLTEQEKLLLNQLRRKLDKTDSQIVRKGLVMLFEKYVAGGETYES